MCHGDIDFEAYEIGRAYQFFKLVSLSLREADNPCFCSEFLRMEKAS
jgi:hypothetical protein